MIFIDLLGTLSSIMGATEILLQIGGPGSVIRAIGALSVLDAGRQSL